MRSLPSTQAPNRDFNGFRDARVDYEAFIDISTIEEKQKIYIIFVVCVFRIDCQEILLNRYNQVQCFIY